MGKKNKSNRAKGQKFLKILIIFIVAGLTVKIILDSVFPVFDRICEEKAKSIATVISNEQATVVMGEHEYDELFTVEKDNNGNIIMIKSNVGPINQIISDVAKNIQNEIDEKGNDNVSIPVGSFTGFKLLAGRGPNIPIKISSMGNVETELKSEFSSQGINQTLHRVYLQVDCEVSILTPYDSITETITNQVLIAENVIIGKIPETYYNFEGLNESDAIEVM